MNRSFTYLTILTISLLTTRAATAAEYHLVLSPENTEITFVLEATGHDVHGTMVLESGDVTFDPETGAASGQLVLDVSKTETGNKSRDKTMHKKVFETETYPQITFAARQVAGELPASGAGEIRFTGTLSIHGDDHEVMLPVSLKVEGDRFEATAQLSVPYVE
ncbi:MAG: YceI family protein [Acidobacteria bacterium]|nr:YceI family protein [Acidobacteriota bacterium]